MVLGGGRPSSAAGWGRPGAVPAEVRVRAPAGEHEGTSQALKGGVNPGMEPESPEVGSRQQGPSLSWACGPVDSVTGTKPAPRLAGEAEAEGTPHAKTEQREGSWCVWKTEGTAVWFECGVGRGMWWQQPGAVSRDPFVLSIRYHTGVFGFLL